MGLGKTIQTIALLAYIKSTGKSCAHLIVVPATTLDNWKHELKSWCPSLNVSTYYGSQAEREEQQEELLEEDFDVLLTTYNLVFQKSDNRFLRKFEFNYLVLGKQKFANLFEFSLI